MKIFSDIIDLLNLDISYLSFQVWIDEKKQVFLNSYIHIELNGNSSIKLRNEKSFDLVLSTCSSKSFVVYWWSFQFFCGTFFYLIEKHCFIYYRNERKHCLVTLTLVLYFFKCTFWYWFKLVFIFCICHFEE